MNGDRHRGGRRVCLAMRSARCLVSDALCAVVGSAIGAAVERAACASFSRVVGEAARRAVRDVVPDETLGEVVRSLLEFFSDVLARYFELS